MTLANLVASPSLARALLVRWYITVPGVLVSMALAVAAYFVFPPQFASTSTVVLIPAAEHGRNTLLSFDTGLNTSAEILVADMNDPQVATDMGLVKGQDTVTVVNGNADSSGKIAASGGPFISVTAQSSTAERATALAAQATTRIQQELTDLQNSVKVTKRLSMNLSPVVSPTPGKLVVQMLLRTMGLALLFGCVVTVAAACLVDRRVRNRHAQAVLSAERATAPTALRSTNGVLQHVDSSAEVDVLAVAMSPEPLSETGRPGRKASAAR
jgi:hypothetical protein